MAVGIIMNHICRNLKHVPMKVLCVLLVVLQAFFLDSLLILYFGHGQGSIGTPCPKCYWWIAGDVVIISLFVITFFMSYKNIEHHNKHKRLGKIHIRRVVPLSVVTWFLYSVYVSARVIVIFRLEINDLLKDDDFYGPQFLKTGIALTAVVFILFVASHHNAKENSKERLIINALMTSVTFDILDTVDFLDVLFPGETQYLLPFVLEHVVLAIAVLNLLRPTFSFCILYLNHFGATNLSRELSAMNAMVYTFFVNTPFMVVRMYLWHKLKVDVSVFLIKNFIMIFIGIHEVYEIIFEKSAEHNANGIELHVHPPNPGCMDGVDGADGEDNVPPTYTSALVDGAEQEASV